MPTRKEKAVVVPKRRFRGVGKPKHDMRCRRSSKRIRPGSEGVTTMMASSTDHCDDDKDLATAKHWSLPNREFEGIWDSLVFDKENPVKTKLISYARTLLKYTDCKVDRNIIPHNRVILLYGPPGTGKTSLCKALAQKLSIDLSKRFKHGRLVEINCNGLFSKWFSESGKLVTRMFEKVQEFASRKDTLVYILIDEVESVAAARKHMMNGNEPSDAMRVVNTFLTQLDAIQRNPQVLIMTTSNITSSLELAFLDRTDMRVYMGRPKPEAIYRIYREGILELMNKEIITQNIVIPLRNSTDKKSAADHRSAKHATKLWSIARASEGLSGRSIKKLLFITQANYIMTDNFDLNTLWDAIIKCVHNEHRQRCELDEEPDL